MTSAGGDELSDLGLEKPIGYFDTIRFDVIEFVAHLVTPGRVLEVGCGSGATLAALGKRFGSIETVGIELESIGHDTAVDRYLVAAIESLSDDEIGRNCFDLVLFADVLEHLVDPWSVVERSCIWLNDSGVVVVSLPNVREARTLVNLVFRGRWSYEASGVLDRTHLRFFTPKSALSLFPEAKWEVLKVTPAMRLDARKRLHWRRLADLATLRLMSSFIYPQFLIAVRPRPSSTPVPSA